MTDKSLNAQPLPDPNGITPNVPAAPDTTFAELRDALATITAGTVLSTPINEWDWLHDAEWIALLRSFDFLRGKRNVWASRLGRSEWSDFGDLYSLVRGLAEMVTALLAENARLASERDSLTARLAAAVETHQQDIVSNAQYAMALAMLQSQHDQLLWDYLDERGTAEGERPPDYDYGPSPERDV